MNHKLAMTILIYFSFLANPVLPAMEKISFRDFGVDDLIRQRFVQNQQSAEESDKGLGSEKIEKPDGRKEIIYYSITTEEEEAERRKEEKEKVERSWEMLRNSIIIDRHMK
jgi:hypothetical protein